MTFVTSVSRQQLERLTQILLSSFPGSTIYQHTNLLHVPHDVLCHKVDVVLLEAEAESADSLDMMQKLCRLKPEIPVFILSKTDCLCEAAVAAGTSGYFVLPDNEQQLLEAIRLVQTKEHTC